MDQSVRTIVISGINLTQGGPLSVFQDCLKALDGTFAREYKIYALVHKKELFSNCVNVEFIEFSNATKSYMFRLYYEYVYFKKLSKVLKPYFWLSIHDITPNVEASIRAVYCHNPSPFFKITKKEIGLDLKFVFFSWFYTWLYRINIEKNNFVIVQQRWLREKFRAKYPIEQCIVAYPVISVGDVVKSMATDHLKYVFFYPTFPRVFKNIEIIAEAILNLEDQYRETFEVLLTINGSENRYAEWIYNKYSFIPEIKFIGQKSREKVFELYALADCLIFPSKLETWGLPISEFKLFGKPMLLADLEYAHETVADYRKKYFFKPNDSLKLARLMEACIDNVLNYDASNTYSIKDEEICHGWSSLFNLLLKNSKEIIC